MMIRRAALEAVGGYRFKIGHDYDLWLRLSDRFELANLRQPVVLHRLHLGQLTGGALEHQTTAAVAFSWAARQRRALGVDPLTGVPELTPEVLRSLPIDEAKVRSALEHELIARAAILADCGHLADAESLVEHASRTLGPRAEAAFAATLELKCAESLVRRRRRLAAVRHVLLAFKHEPRHTFSLVCDWLAPTFRVPV
jgi:hypothetical protein